MVYIQFINIVLSFINLTSGSTSPVIDPEVIIQLRKSTDGLTLSNIFYNLLMNQDFILNSLIIITVLGVLMAGVYYVLKFFYFRVLNKENERIDVEIKNNIKLKKPTMLFKKIGKQ